MFSLFCSFVEGEELLPGDTGTVTESPLDELDEEEEEEEDDSFQLVLGFPIKGSFCRTPSLGFPSLGSLF